MHHDFLGSEGFQGTHMDALNQFSSKLMTLTLRGGLWTFLANLALCAPHRRRRWLQDDGKEEFPCFLYLIQIFVKSHVETRNHHHHHSMNFETPPAPTTKFLLPSKFSSNSCDKDKNENPLQVCKRKYFRFYNVHDRSSEVIFYTLDDPAKQS